jgi:hypothetical protein
MTVVGGFCIRHADAAGGYCTHRPRRALYKSGRVKDYSGDRPVAVVCVFFVWRCSTCVHLPISIYSAYTETQKNNYKEFLRL